MIAAWAAGDLTRKFLTCSRRQLENMLHCRQNHFILPRSVLHPQGVYCRAICRQRSSISATKNSIITPEEAIEQAEAQIFENLKPAISSYFGKIAKGARRS